MLPRTCGVLEVAAPALRQLALHDVLMRYRAWHAAAQAGARRVDIEMVRSTGVAPASPDWHSGILLLNDDRKSAARAAA